MPEQVHVPLDVCSVQGLIQVNAYHAKLHTLFKQLFQALVLLANIFVLLALIIQPLELHVILAGMDIIWKELLLIIAYLAMEVA